MLNPVGESKSLFRFLEALSISTMRGTQPKMTSFLRPSHLIFSLLCWNLVNAIVARAASHPEAKPRLRALSQRQDSLQWPAARAVVDDSRLTEELVARIPENDLVERQNYYAFSGAIYIVGANGQALQGLNAASPAYCPNSAPQSCGNIGVWNWCCPSGNTCAWADYAQTYVGCCPAGCTCQQGSINQYVTSCSFQIHVKELT